MLSEEDLLNQYPNNTSNFHGDFLPTVTNDNVDHWLEHTGVPDPKFPATTSQMKPPIVTNDRYSGKRDTLFQRTQTMSGLGTISDFVPIESASQSRLNQLIKNDTLLAKRYSNNRLPDDPTSKELGFHVTPQCDSDGSPIQASNVAPLEPFATKTDPSPVVGDGTSEETRHIGSCAGQPIMLTHLDTVGSRPVSRQHREDPAPIDFTGFPRQLQVSKTEHLDSAQDRAESQTPLVPSASNRVSGVGKIKNAAKDLKNTIRKKKSRSS